MMIKELKASQKVLEAIDLDLAVAEGATGPISTARIAANAKKVDALKAQPLRCDDCGIPIAASSNTAVFVPRCGLCQAMVEAVSVQPNLTRAHGDWLREQIRKEKLLGNGQYFEGGTR